MPAVDITAAAGHAVDLASPVQIADRIWWVGVMRPGDTFQCHAYLVVSDRGAVLIDPGSMVTIRAVLERVEQVVPLADVHWIVCHHSDPDIAGCLPYLRTALPADDLQVLTEWRAETLLQHYDAGIPFYRVEDHGWTLPLDDVRSLRFVLTPYLHFPGAMCSYEPSTGVLFTSDIFGGFTNGGRLFAQDMSYFDDVRPFHEHYMPSNDILQSGLARLQQQCRPINLVAPQHGCIIPASLVAPMFHELGQLECGIFLMAREDLDIARLLKVSSTLRTMIEALIMAHDIPELARVAERVLPEVIPVDSIELYADGDEGLLRFASDNRYAGAPGAPPTPSADSLVLPIPGDGPTATLVLHTTGPVDRVNELNDMFLKLAPAVRAALNRHFEQLKAEHEHDQLRATATHDALTGLYNRHALDVLARPDDSFAVLMIDIDLFKRINDRYGHHIGDIVLGAVAAAIQSVIRTVDAAVRFGGEEVLVLLADADRSSAEQVAERVRARIEEVCAASAELDSAVTVSVGVAMHHSGQPVGEAIDDADRCLYRAKERGRNRVCTAWE